VLRPHCVIKYLQIEQSSSSSNCCIRVLCLVGFVSATDKHRINAFIRRCSQSGLCPTNHVSTFEELTDSTDEHLFDAILANSKPCRPTLPTPLSDLWFM